MSEDFRQQPPAGPGADVASAKFVIVKNETGKSQRWLATDEPHAQQFARALASHGAQVHVFPLGDAA